MSIKTTIAKLYKFIVSNNIIQPVVASAFLGTLVAYQFGLIGNYQSSVSTNQYKTKSTNHQDSNNELYQINQQKKRKTIRLLLVNSYSEQDPCGRPQEIGFIKRINEFELANPEYNFTIETFYMQTKTINVSKASRIRQAEMIMSYIRNKFTPDYIITFDDNAFNYVGLPLSRRFRVIFSGINKDIEFYKNDPRYDENISGVLETPKFQGIFKFLRIANINKIVILYSMNPSETESGMFNYYVKYISQIKGIEFSYKQFCSIEDLIKYLKKNNNPEHRVCYFIAITSLYSFASKKYVNLSDIIKIIVKYNHTHPEFTLNPILPKVTKLALAEGVNFYDMGYEAANLLIDEIEKKNNTNRIITLKSIFTCNLQRLNELNLGQYMPKASSLFDSIF